MNPRPNTNLSRRQLLQYGAVATGTAALAGCARGLGGSGSSAKSLEFMFWGEGDQNKKLIAAVDLYQKTKGALTVKPQYSGFSGYYDKLATRVAGGNPPDIFQIHLPYLLEYIKRGAVQPLDQYQGELGLESLPSYLAPTVKNDGKYWFALLGAATQPAVIVNTAQLHSLGLSSPSTDWALDDYRTVMTQVYDKSNHKVFGTSDQGGSAIALESFIRGLGKPLFDKGGKLAFTSDDLARWLTFWQQMRSSGGAVPMKVTAAATGFQNDPLTTGAAAYTVTATSRGLPSIQSLTKDSLALATFPASGTDASPGTNIIPAGWFAISPKSKNIAAAVGMLKFLTSSIDAAKTMGMARGVPIPQNIRSVINASATGLDKVVLANYALVVGKDPSSLQMYPPGASNLLQTSLPNINQMVGFGQLSVEKAAIKFFTDAKTALG